MKLEFNGPEQDNGNDISHFLLHECIKSKNIEMLIKILCSGRPFNINEPNWNESGNAPILEAATYGELGMVRVLCDNECDVNVKTLRGETVLHLVVSCQELNLNMINLLLSKNCNADVQDNLNRQTALHVFIKKHLMTGEVNDNVLAVFEILVTATNINIADRRLRTPLHSIASCRKADFRLIQILLNKQANPNLQNDRGETPLHEALENNNESVAELLINAGTNLFLATKYRETPLHIAARKNLHNTVNLLLKKNSPINAEDLYGNTALHLATSKGYNHVVRLLIEHNNIQLNISNKEGLTPLHLAVESGFICTVEILVKADSCDLSARTKRCETPLDLAQQEYRRRSQPEMTEVLFREIERRSCGKSL